MKLFGKTIDKPKEEVLVIPREGKDHVFKAEAILDFTELDKMNPEPELSSLKNVKEGTSKKVKGKDYNKKMDDYATNRMNYMMVKSLEATEGLEWETIEYDKIKTYANYKQELLDSGITDGEVGMLVAMVLIANSLSDAKYEEARKRFLALPSKKA
jgi:hypothetical protein